MFLIIAKKGKLDADLYVCRWLIPMWHILGWGKRICYGTHLQGQWGRWRANSLLSPSSHDARVYN